MISTIVNAMHVDTSNEDVEHNIRTRCAVERIKGGAVTAELEDEWVAQALRVHEENRKIHAFVVWQLKD